MSIRYVDFEQRIGIPPDRIAAVYRDAHLAQRGSRLCGTCPSCHAEKFSVNPANGLFYCFGCGVGGGIDYFPKWRGGST